MDIGLFISIAGNVLSIIAMLVLAVKLATARQDLEDAQEDAADAQGVADYYREVNGKLLTELTGFREKAALVRAGALKASRASAEARKSRLNAH